MNISDLKIGDVILESLPDSFYGCMIVLEVDYEENSALVMISKYFSKEIPTLENPLLMKAALNKVITRKMDYQSRGDKFQQNSNLYKVIGNLDVSHIKINDMILYENLSTISLYYEWLEKHDNSRYKEKIALLQTLEKNKSEYIFMALPLFWKIIEEYLANYDSSKLLIKKLSELKKDEIIQFHNTLANMIENLSVLKVYDPLVENDDYLSEDAILYTKCYVVSRGELYYKKILESGILDLSDDNHDFEKLLYAAEEALELRGVLIDYDKMKNIE
ncbi:DUF4240 domain-containing protein [Macrococcoides goetzii]|uniref:DUF4240 domain-containing protein n=1 Tax=Macrococcus sp. PK TaxID=2801919 RepID=UPI001F0FE9F6|nr:DUF4240 domain-containing protein [Macrococcus sp. PK]MCH4985785.1 DUF4240 domain-containing protein [Macrococcus sp. PK]